MITFLVRIADAIVRHMDRRSVDNTDRLLPLLEDRRVRVASWRDYGGDGFEVTFNRDGVS